MDDPQKQILTAFEIFGRITDDWLLDAARLKQAANVILAAIKVSEPHPYSADLLRGKGEPLTDKNDWLTPVYMFLAGASLESLVKAILIGRDMGYVKATQVKSTLATHNLRHLLNLARFDLTTDQEDLVDRLSEWIMWAGRYPVPKNANPADQFADKLNLHDSADPAAIDLLFASLHEIYVAEQTAREEQWKALSDPVSNEKLHDWTRHHLLAARAVEDFAATSDCLNDSTQHSVPRSSSST